MARSVVDRFSPATREWFVGTFGEPTAAQAGAWEAISQNDHTLVVAPTGSGKTLSAFLWALDRIGLEDPPKDVDHKCRVLYISPMKALAVDVERNLRSPLVGVSHAATRLGLERPDISVAVRSGDTTPKERRAFTSHSADILITTPESLYLLLTSAAREKLKGVEYVIIDEIHAVAGTKRGAHLAVSLERLDQLLAKPAQRIGLSATVAPISEVERFLAGGRPVTTVAPPPEKTWDLDVVVPVEDMADLATSSTPSDDFDDHAPTPSASIWPHVEERVVDLIAAHRSTLVFANSRRLAERLTARLNEIWAERLSVAQEASASDHAIILENDDVSVGNFILNQKAPAQMMGNAGQTNGAPAILARAHHGSVSKDVRGDIETELKAGRLPAVVATSSLELGIDMGAIDLVIQVESPPSVASGLQRIGRAGHQVGATSHGVLFPKFRSDLLSAAVAVQRMKNGQIESIAIPRTPLDVLAQQIVAMLALDDWQRSDLLGVLRKSAPFATLSDSVLDSVLDMLAGRYPSDAFRELRPRIVWDRTTDILSGRPGAQRLAVISGGTIPDRGLYGVFLAGEKGPGRRVGELDEEMVYESRVGDIFTLGSSTWRIEDITRDQVLVTPAPGQAARLPFWKGDALGRPSEFGRGIGEFTRELDGLSDKDAAARCRDIGLDGLATQNLLTYVREQRESTGSVPSDRTVVIERFRDEMGDWRVVVHSPFGAPIHAPWALLVAARIQEQFGIDVQGMHTDDGLVFRLLDGEGDEESLMAALSEAVLLIPDEIPAAVTEQVGSTALFAARFRECAARALLLPRYTPGRRQALWQQRQRAAQLLEVARDFPSFPIILEAVREVLQDVYDVDGLVTLMRDIASRRVQVVHVETASPSPFAKGLLFNYVAQYLYEGDSPLAERRAAALSLDPELLADLLGSRAGQSLADLLDPHVVASYEAQLQRTDPERHLRNSEELSDALRLLGPLSADDIQARSTDADIDAWWSELVAARRAIEVQWGGQKRLAAIEDAARLRDALGVALPPGVPQVFLEPVATPLDDLLLRYASTHVPFSPENTARHFGLGVSIVTSALATLSTTGRLTHGSLLPEQLGGGESRGEYSDPQVLRVLRRRSLAALRSEIEPVPATQYAQFLPRWQRVGEKMRGADGVMAALEPLLGVPMPASAIESLILPARVASYRPADLDELITSGELMWQGHGTVAKDDGLVSFHTPETVELTLAITDTEPSEPAQGILDLLSAGGSHLARDIVTESGLAPTEFTPHLWSLVWSGFVTGDSFAPVRAILNGGKTSHRSRSTSPRSSRYARLRGPSLRAPIHQDARLPTEVLGRWRALPNPSHDMTARTLMSAEMMLSRYGIVTRGSAIEEEITGGFAAIYKVLTRAEESGIVRRGYFIEHLGASQFAGAPAIDALRATKPPKADAWGSRPVEALILAANDPANPYGGALAWPSAEEEHGGHRPGRKAGSIVALVDGELLCYIERGGRTALAWPGSEAAWNAVAKALAALIDTGQLESLTLRTLNGKSALTSDHALIKALTEAGFHAAPQGLRKRR